MEDTNSQESTPLQSEAPEASFHFTSDGGELVTIKPDGTVILHKEGADKQAAQAFWGAMGNELKNIEHALIWERDQWKDKYEELHAAIVAIIDGMMRPPQAPSIVMPGNTPPLMSPSAPPPMPLPQDLNKLMKEGGPINLRAGGTHRVIVFDPSKIDTGFYKEADGSTHIVYKGKKLF